MSVIKIRPAIAKDAQGMSVVLSEIISMWKSDRSSDPDYVRAFYIQHPQTIQCVVAKDSDGTILGFQSLRLAIANNQYGVTPGWGIVGTYVKLDVGRRGVGSKLFSKTVEAAKQAGLLKIDASIGKDNELGLAYYEALGFRTYDQRAGAICKCYIVSDNLS